MLVSSFSTMNFCFICISNYIMKKISQNFDGTPIRLGHYVPQLAQAIKRYHEATDDKSINLKGYMVCFYGFGNSFFTSPVPSCILIIQEYPFSLSKLDISSHICNFPLQFLLSLTFCVFFS